MPDSESISVAYGRLLARCQPFDVAALPGALPIAVEGAFQSPGAAALEDMCAADIPSEAWLASGIFENVERRTVAAGLAEPGAPLIALRSGAGGAVTDILTQRDCLSAKLPALAMMEDASTRKLLKAKGTDNHLCITFDLCDLITLRSWGIAAVPATVMGDLSPDDLRELCRRLGLRSRIDVSDSSSGKSRYLPNGLDIVFVGWSPATLDRTRPVGLESVGRFWSQLEKFLDIDLSVVGLWLPDESDVARLAFQQRFGEPQKLRATVSYQMDVLPALTEFFTCVPKKSKPILSLQKARADWISAKTNPKATPAQIASAQAAFHEALDRELIQLLVDDANRTPLPQSRAVKLLLASAVELAEMQAPQLHADIAKGFDQNSVTAKLFDARFHRYHSNLDRIQKLLAELQN